ncbi:hypothetical protein AAG570_006838 [Ranatra chinensis]|uniref:FOXO protein transactivation domain-containing protein n=1 Tax=Ranatra chinensis TaxID=642074 RepID=A0ABD0YV82_9HEMI
MRVQNEGTGKSSWWVLNPDAKPGKSARRRATSMETSKFEKRRGRVKKKVEALRSGLDATPSPSSSISESLDIFPESPLHGFQLSPDFRPRASSNASSCGGRLSPIPSGAEGEWGYYGPEQLAGSLEQTMRLGQEAVAPPGFAYPIPPPPYRPAPAYTAPHPCPLNHRHMQPCPCTPTNPLNIKCNFFLLLQREYQTSESPSPPATTMMGQLMGALNPAMLDELNELNINIDTLPLSGGFDCNVDEVIRHELSLDGSLDFNFTQQQAPQPGQEQHPFSGHSWVH